MPEPTPDSRTIAEGRSGGISLFSILLLLAGAGLLAFQLVLALSGRLVETDPAARFTPGALGLLFVLFFALKAFRRGQVRVFADRASGRTIRGRSWALRYDEIGRVDLRTPMLVLRDAQDKVLVADRPPRPAALRGLIWLLHAYRDALPDAVLAKLGPPEGPVGQEEVLHREFRNADGLPRFFDAGFLAQAAGGTWFIPVTDTVRYPRPIGREKSLSTTLLPDVTVVKFEPNPAHLPLYALCKAIAAAGLDPAREKELLAMLADAHGGTELERDGDGWTGETAGMPIFVFSPERVKNPQQRAQDPPQS